MPHLVTSPRGVLVAQSEPPLLCMSQGELSEPALSMRIKYHERQRADAQHRWLTAAGLVAIASYPIWLLAESLV